MESEPSEGSKRLGVSILLSILGIAAERRIVKIHNLDKAFEVVELILGIVILNALEVKGVTQDAHLVAVLASRLDKRIVHTHTRHTVLEIDDGLLVLPIGLHNHALNVGAGDAPGTQLLLLNVEPLVAGLTSTLPLLIIKRRSSRLLLGMARRNSLTLSPQASISV